MIYILQLALSFMAFTVSLAVMLVSLELVLTLWRRRSPELRLKPKAKATDPIPDSLVEWFEQESETWARDQLRTEAQTLRKGGASWEDVELTLKQLYGEASTEEVERATERAWLSTQASQDEDIGL